MKFVKIIPPEAGKLDEHRALVAVAGWELDRLRDSVRRWAAVQEVAELGTSETDTTLAAELLDAADRLYAQIEQAAAPADRPRCSCGAELVDETGYPHPPGCTCHEPNCAGPAAAPAGEDA